MVLTNADRQRRYREKVRALAKQASGEHPAAQAVDRGAGGGDLMQRLMNDQFIRAGVALLENLPSDSELVTAAITEFESCKRLGPADLLVMASEAGQRAAIDVLRRHAAEFYDSHPLPEPEPIKTRKRQRSRKVPSDNM